MNQHISTGESHIRAASLLV